jgi:hypothetical protein
MIFPYFVTLKAKFEIAWTGMLSVLYLGKTCFNMVIIPVVINLLSASSIVVTRDGLRLVLQPGGMAYLG